MKVGANVKNAIEMVKSIGELKVTAEEAKNIPLAELAREAIVSVPNGDGFVLRRYQAEVVKEKSIGHDYVAPAFFPLLKADCLCTSDWDNFPSQNILFFGHAGTGKTECVEFLAKELGDLPVFLVQGGPNQTIADFWGEKSIQVDADSKQNKIVFDKGVLYQAFIQGTKLDENGHQILLNERGERVYDATGEPVLEDGAKPAILFCDESSMTPESVFTAAFNTSMCIPRNAGRGRVGTVPTDNNRIVKSHPGMIMIFAANNNWIGQDNADSYGYTSQIGTKDASTRNRITSFYEFGYSEQAENNIICNALHDDKAIASFLKFRDSIRKAYEEEPNIQTVFSTRNIVAISNKARLYMAAGLCKDACKAVVMAIDNVMIPSLFSEEKEGWKMNVNLCFDHNIKDSLYDGMRILRKKY